MGPYDDILANLEKQESETLNTNTSKQTVYPHSVESLSEDNFFDLEKDSVALPIQETHEKAHSKWGIFSKIMFLLKYMATSTCIFAILMLVSNYSAYYNIAYSVIYAKEMETTSNGLIESVEAASNIDEKVEYEAEVNTFRALEKETWKKTYTSDMHSIGQLIAKAEKWVDLWIEITPYENRIVIPKIGKNIPLVDIVNQNIEGENELNDIFMKELENGVIRYPGSALPWEAGNSFIFGHSSNFPWLEWNYNDVFALLDNLDDGDEIIVYYEQKKFTYKINRKDVIKPGDVWIIKNKDKSVKELTVMTCWPIGTTFNRLVVVAELINVE